MAIVVSSLVAASLLSGCKKEEKATQSEGKSSENVVITLGCWGSSPSETKLLDDQIQAFQNDNPNITIKKQVQVGDYMQAIQSKIASKSAPDIYYLDVSLADQFISKGVIDPIDDYIDKEDVKDFYPNLLGGYQKDGKTYGLPKDYNSLVLFYNQEMFDKAGLKPPTTWEELKEVAPKLTNDKAVALCLENDAQRFGAFMLQAGAKINDGDKAAFNTAEGAKGLDFYYSFHKDGYAKTPKDLGVDWAGPALAQEKAAMVVAGAWIIPFMKDNAPNVKYGMVKLPKGEKEGGLLFTVAYVLNKDSKNKKEAAEVLKYLTGKDAMQMVATAGLAMPSRQSMAGEFTKTFPERQALVDMAPASTVANYGLNGSKILDALGKAGEKIQFKQAPDAATALKEAEDSLK
jgi:multiple sugar transport system substrate-binding protein